MSVERGKPRNPDQEFHQRYTNLQGDFYTAEARATSALAKHDTDFQQGIYPDPTDIMQGIHDRATTAAGTRWLGALNVLPEMNDTKRLKVWEERDRLEAATIAKNQEQPEASESGTNPLDGLYAKGTPSQELNARDGDLDGKTAAANLRLREAYGALLATGLTDAQLTSIGNALDAFGAVSELRTDQIWRESHAVTEPDEDVVRVWDTKNVLRSSMGPRWEKLYGDEEQA